MIRILLMFTLCIFTLFNCNSEGEQNKMDNSEGFKYFIEKFADINIGRYKIPGFDELTINQKKLIYYLYQAANSGRDIYWDQNFKHNLRIRRTLETIVKKYEGDRESRDFKNFMTYTKRIWFSNGIHHHYSTDKIMPEFSRDFFSHLIHNCAEGTFPLENKESLDDLISFLTPIIFDPQIAKKRISTNTEADLIKESATNFYENLSQAEVIDYYSKKTDQEDSTPISYGLNSKLIKENGTIKEKVWKIGGMYSEAIKKIVYWLEQAATVAENQLQKKTIELLIKFYKTGNLKVFDEYSISWTKDTVSQVDFVNGFIETYGDPLNYRGSYESLVSFRNEEATKRAKAISNNAQWFEDNSPIHNEFKKKKVKGISAKVITIAALAGEASPNPPIGINLPNANWIRKTHGSKSVTLGNITYAYNKVLEGGGLLEEFAFSEEEINRAKKHGELAENLHTDMHEIIGHGSGQIKHGVAPPRETLKSYAAAIGETRADLVAYYYVMDPKLIEIGVTPSLESGKASYDKAIRNGMMRQLTRIRLGNNIEQAHMRNRQLIAKWAFDLGKSESVIEEKVKDNKRYFVINDYEKLRKIFGDMLREIQRISSEGDYETAKKLIEEYAVIVDYDLHKEVLKRYAKLGLAPYTGFINPVLNPVIENENIVDIKIEYPTDFEKQMLLYSQQYSFLPNYN